MWDLNVDFSKDCNPKFLLSCGLESYNLFHVVDFPTNNTSCSIIDNCRINLFKVLPIINGLSDHDVQYLILNNVFSSNKGNNSICNKRLITEATVLNFVTVLKVEPWNDIYCHHDVNKSCNSFPNSFLIYSESCFPMHHTTKN
jgi:hypothetical protein